MYQTRHTDGRRKPPRPGPTAGRRLQGGRVARGLSSAEVNKLMRLGAAARLAELEREIAALRRAFPGLTSATAADTKTSVGAQPPSAAASAAKKARRGRRKPMNAAERKAVSERMKRYWAERRKKKS